MSLRGNSNNLIIDFSYFKKPPEAKGQFGGVIKTHVGLLATLASTRQRNIRKYSGK